ncbi:hypothetical protein U9M48_018663 [Paspalum notatum var. saurae]|uniref:Helitron helicase-like domain-containing protein n=1 Tax=Paspalum notatum var. saurae TaxID=547442 RepID=A0AAQ3TC73_PASNO
MGANIDHNINKSEGPYVFRIDGQIHHRIGSLLPKPNNLPKYAELYIFDTQNEIENRIKALCKEDPTENDINPYIAEELGKMLDRYNPFAKTFRHARDLFEKYKTIDISIRIIGAKKGDPIQYEMPHTEELAMVIVGDLSLEKYKRDIIVSTKRGGLQHISIFHQAYMALQYPLLFPYGERGFQLGIPYEQKENNRKPKRKRNTVTFHEHYKYHMHYRPNQPNPFLCYGRLSKQAIVDARAMEDEDRLMRYIIQNYHDGIAICRVYGLLDLFITFTCNPKWPEIISAILQGEQPNDRPDIIVQVFHMKLQQMLEDIRSGTIFGTKRGLPHVHILVWIDKNEDEISPEIIDLWVFAEIPNPSEDPLGYILVSEHMMHGPCGEKNEKCPCMKKGKCSKYYPKDF